MGLFFVGFALGVSVLAVHVGRILAGYARHVSDLKARGWML